MSGHDHADHGHHHHGPGHHHHHHAPEGQIGVAFALNVSFTLVELFGAYFTNSTAIAADALHDLGDSLALGFAWGMQGLSGKSGSERFTFGLKRLSLLSAGVNALVLLVGGVVVLSEAVPRVMDPQAPEPLGMLGLAVLGVAVNGLAAWRMRGGESMNERVVALHLMEDVLGWVAVLVVSLVMLVWDVPVLDPLLAIGITLFIGYGAARNLWRTLSIFLQAIPDGLDLPTVEQTLGDVDGVLDVQHLHVWSQDGSHHVLTGRLDIDPDASLERARDVRDAARHALEHLGVAHVTLEVHPAGTEPDESCA